MVSGYGNLIYACLLFNYGYIFIELKKYKVILSYNSIAVVQFYWKHSKWLAETGVMVGVIAGKTYILRINFITGLLTEPCSKNICDWV